jgi:hypothetical protein
LVFSNQEPVIRDWVGTVDDALNVCPTFCGRRSGQTGQRFGTITDY